MQTKTIKYHPLRENAYLSLAEAQKPPNRIKSKNLCQSPASRKIVILVHRFSSEGFGTLYLQIMITVSNLGLSRRQKFSPICISFATQLLHSLSSWNAELQMLITLVSCCHPPYDDGHSIGVAFSRFIVVLHKRLWLSVWSNTTSWAPVFVQFPKGKHTGHACVSMTAHIKQCSLPPLFCPKLLRAVLALQHQRTTPIPTTIICLYSS